MLHELEHKNLCLTGSKPFTQNCVLDTKKCHNITLVIGPRRIIPLDRLTRDYSSRKYTQTHLMNPTQGTSITLVYETKINEFVKQVSIYNVVSKRLHSGKDGNKVLSTIFVQCGVS